MADKKITELTAYSPTIDTDLIPIVDITTSTTKKVAISTLKTTFWTSPVIIGTLTAALILGGTSTIQTLTFQTTSGVGNTGANMLFKVGNNGGTTAMTILNSGNVGIGTTAPTAALHLKAGTATAGTAPLKFTSGTNLTTAEAGAMEWNGTNLFITQTGLTRKTIAYTSDITGGYIPYTGGTSDVNLGVHNLTVDTNSLFVNSVNHKVGIGTTAPESKLTLPNGGYIGWQGFGSTASYWTIGHTDATSAYALRYISTGGDYDYNIMHDFVTGTTSRMVITNIGNIGIGTTSPTAVLHLKAGTATASTAPLKFTKGTLLTTPELGAVEFVDNTTDGHLYITLNVAGVLTRVQIV